jgi:UDP-glucose 6-dehydrogenase
MKSLTTEQKQQLVEIINEEFGNELDLAEFTDALLGLLEDVPGFETMRQSSINKLTQQLWRKYHD